MPFLDDLDNLFMEGCNEAIGQFKRTDAAYGREVKIRAELSEAAVMLVEHDGGICLTEEQRKCVAEYIVLLTGPEELEALVACYVHGMRDCVKWLRRLDVIRRK